MIRVLLLASLALASCAPLATAPSSPGDNPVLVDPTPAATPTPAPSTGTVVGDAAVRASAALDRAWRDYLVIRDTADLVRPFLSPTRAAALQILRGRIEAAFVAARLATNLVDQAAQLELAVRTARQLDAIVTDPN